MEFHPMKIRIYTVATSVILALLVQACTNTQPAYYGAYPSNFDFGANHGYEPYASAPYDPYGAYYQNYGPATPYYYEPPASHRDCDARPCIAYRRNASEPLEPEIIALPQKKEPLNPPSTISRTRQTYGKRHHHRNDEDDSR
jgi:hypothetical protein